ncbi:hypothetical protein JXA05_01275 [Candidatus Peregrinibacteria bacterium]|nr:hypothetical protein [Candidatus Peregrinibacteria bacterium]
MDITFWTGIVGSLVLVTGAAWPEPKTGTPPTRSSKNWLLAVGAALMLLYAILGWKEGGAVFFVILEILVVIAAVLMMADVDDRIDAVALSVSGAGLIAWSLYLFEGYNTIIFIVGLVGIGLGYAFRMGTLRRGVALTLGSALIALFSYLEASWIFFWLNVFFALFSAYYVGKAFGKPNPSPAQ